MDLDKIKKLIKDNFSGLEQSVASIYIGSDSYNTTNMELVRFLVEEQKRPGVYISINKPYKTLKEHFEKEKIDHKMMIFIDAITKMSGGQVEKVDNCIFINDPKNLTEIGIAVTEALHSIPTKTKFILLDSVSTLTVYNSQDIVTKFAHSLSAKIREMEVSGFLMSMQNKAGLDLMPELSQFCDILINVDDQAKDN